MRHVIYHTPYKFGSILRIVLTLLVWLELWISNAWSLMYPRVLISPWRNIWVTDSPVAIQSLVSDLELIQYTMPGLPPDYQTFVITYSMLPGSCIFDDLCSKLIFYEQRLKFQSSRETTVYQALISTVSSGSNTQGGSSRNQTTTIKVKINQHNWNNKGCHNRGGNRNNTNNSRQNDSNSRNMPTGTIFGKSDFSSLSTYCASTFDTNSFSAGTNKSKGILESHPNTIY